MSTKDTSSTARTRLGLTSAAIAAFGSAADIVPQGTQTAGATGRIADAGHIHPNGDWGPADNNLIWGSYNPLQAGLAFNPPVGTVPGKLTLQRVLLRKSATLSNILFGLSGVDTTGPVTDSYLGVYDSTGTLRAVTADISSIIMATATLRTVAFTAPYAAAVGEYFIALLLNGTWTTALTWKASGGGVTANAGLAAPHLVMASMLTGQVTLPSSITLASMGTGLITGGWGSQWYGLS
jgi:hypothetical protein